MNDTAASRTLDRIESYPESRYAQLDLAGLAAFTVKWLLDRHVPTTFENVVVAAFKMFPAKFSLVGYSEYPDAARVNRSLLQLGPKYRNWARGSVQKGFVLTQSGLSKVENVERSLSKGSTAPQGKEQRKARPRTIDLGEELKDLEASSLYEKWKNGQLEDGTVLELLDMLSAYAYAPPRALRERIQRLEQKAAQAGREELLQFLKTVSRAFSSSLKDM